MNVLWITPQLPCRVGGGQSHQYNLLQHLAERHRITVAALASPLEQKHIAEAREACQKVIALPYSPPAPASKWRNRWNSWRQLLLDPWPHYARTYPLEMLRTAVGHLLHQDSYDIVHLEHLAIAPLRSEFSRKPALLACHNVEQQVARQSFFLQRRPTRKVYSLIEWLKLRRFEKRWLRCFDALTAISEADASFLRELVPDAAVHIVPNGVDVAYFAPPLDTPRQGAEILFVGTLGYWPNADGVLFFHRQVWPLVRQACPQASLTIVGANPPPEVRCLEHPPEIVFTGYVPDVRPHFWRAALSVVPLRAGSGIRNKILESLAAGCPVVSTTLGAAGLDLGPEEGLRRADEPSALAGEIIDLIRRPEHRAALGVSGQAAVAYKYAWPAIARRLEQAYVSTLRPDRT